MGTMDQQWTETPREIMQTGSKMYLGPGDRLRLLSLKIEDLRFNKTIGKLSYPVQQNVQTTYTLYKAVTSIIS